MLMKLITLIIFLLLSIINSNANDNLIIFTGDTLIIDDHPEYLNRGFRNTNEYLEIELNTENKVYINLIMGNLIYERTDFYNNDISFPLQVKFYYNSGSTFSSRYGNRWNFIYNLKYYTNNINNNIIFNLADDKTILFSNYLTDEQNFKFQQIENGYILYNFKDDLLNKNDYSEYVYNSLIHHYVTQIIDRNFNKIVFTYNYDKDLVGLKFPSNRSILIFYNDNKLLNKINIERYGDILYRYDNNFNLSSVKYIERDSIIYDYDNNCNLLTNIKISNIDLKIEYNDSSLVKKIILNDSITYNLDYDFKNYTNYLTSNAGNRYIIKYDSSFKTKLIFKNDKLISEKKWDKNNLISYTNPNGNTYNYEYDSLGLIMKIIYPDGNWEQIFRESKYNKITNINKSTGKNTNFIYDLKGNLFEITINNDKISNFDYNKNGQIIKFNNNNFLINFLYDGYGNFNRILINKKAEFDIDYNIVGDITRIFELSGFEIKYNRDYFRRNILIENFFDAIFKKFYFNSFYLPDSIIINNNLFEFKYDKYLRVNNYLINSNKDSIKINYSENNYSLKNSIFEYSYKYFKELNKKEIYYNNNLISFFYDNNNQLTDFLLNNELIENRKYNKIDLLSEITYFNKKFNIFYLDNKIFRIITPEKYTLEYLYYNSDDLKEFKFNDLVYKFNLINDSVKSVILPNKLQIIYNQDLDNIYIKNFDEQLYVIKLDNYNRISKLIKNQVEIFNQSFYKSKLKNLNFHYGLNIFNEYDDNLNLTKHYQNDNLIKSFKYDKYNNLIQISTELYDVKFEYNLFKNLIKINNINQLNIGISDINNTITIDNTINKFIYEFKNNKLFSVQNSNFNTLYFNYNNNLISKISGLENIEINFDYDQSNLISSIYNSNNLKTLFNYDKYKRLTSLINKNNNAITFKYNLNNKVVEYTDFNNETYILSYLFDNYLRKITFPDLDSISLQLNDNFNIKKIIKFNEIIYYNWNEKGQLSGLFTNYDSIYIYYNNLGKIRSINFNNQLSISKDYNNFGKIKSINYNNWINLYFLWNKNLNLTKVLLDSNVIINLNYDLLKNLNYFEFFGKFIRYSYDNLNQITSSNDYLNSSIKYNYDKIGRIILKTYNNNNQTEEFTYQNNKLIKFKDNNSNNFEFKYDKLGYLIQLKINGFDSIFVSRNSLGEISELKSYDNLFYKFNYNKKGLISKIDITNFNFLYEFNYDYNNFKIIINNNLSENFSLKLDSSGRYKNISKYDELNYFKLGLKTKVKNYTITYNSNLLYNSLLQKDSLNYFEYFYKNSIIPYKLKYLNVFWDIIPSNLLYIWKINNNLENWSFDRFENVLINKINFNSGNLIDFTYDQNSLINNLNSQFFGNIKIDYYDPYRIKSINSSNEKLNFEYYVDNNLKSINYNNKSILSNEYNTNKNLIVTENAEGNKIEIFYDQNHNINQILFSDGKFYIYDVNNQNLLINSKSNTNISDSINFKYLGNQIIEKNISLFNNKIFNFKIQNKDLVLKINNKIYSILKIEKLSTIYNLSLNNDRITIDIENNFLKFNDTEIQTNINQNKIFSNIKNNNNAINYEEHTNIPLLTKEIFLNEQILNERNYNPFDKLVYSIQNYEKLTINYKENQINSLIKNNDTLIYYYNNDKLLEKINDNIKIQNNLNGSIKLIDSANLIYRFFYDEFDRISEIIDKNSNKYYLMYNSLGELSSIIINTDTTYILSFEVDTIITLKIILNENKNQFDIVLLINSVNNPIIYNKYFENNSTLILRDREKIPFVKILKNGDVKQFDELKNILGEYKNLDNIFNFTFKNYFYIKELNLYVYEGLLYNPYLSLEYNNTFQNIIFRNYNKNEINFDKYNINSKYLDFDFNPFSSHFYDLPNYYLKKYISDEINHTFNNFSPFNTNFKLKQKKNYNFILPYDKVVDQFLPNLYNLLSEYNGNLIFYPKLPIELLDTFFIKNYKPLKFVQPELPKLTNGDNIANLLKILKLAEVDTNFVLFKSIKIFDNYNKLNNINLPNNIIKDEIFTPDFDEINKIITYFDNFYRTLINSKYDTTDKDDLILLLDNFKENLSNRDIFNWNIIFNNIDINLPNVEQFLPKFVNNIENIKNQNLRNLFYLCLFDPYKNYNPSKILLEDQFIELPKKQKFVPKFLKLPLIKQLKEIK